MKAILLNSSSVDKVKGRMKRPERINALKGKTVETTQMEQGRVDEAWGYVL